MSYTISQVAQWMGLPVSTLRYYDKVGLLSQVGRTASGYRKFEDSDLERLSLIECLKGVGLSLEDIRRFVALLEQGDDTLEQRYALFAQQEQRLLAQQRELQVMLETIRYKKWRYEAAVQAGTSAAIRHPEAYGFGPCPYENVYYRRILEAKQRSEAGAGE